MADGMQHIEPQAQFFGMSWSETRVEFAKAFAKAQSELGPILKDTKNDFFKSKYADLSNVLAAVMPALNQNGISLIQAPAFDGQKVSVTTMLLHASGEWMETRLDMIPTKKDPQGVGSCITYGRRYAALSVAGVAPEDDDGNAASQPQKANKARSERLTKAQARELYSELQQGMRGHSFSEELKAWGKENASRINTLPQDWADNIRDEYMAELNAFVDNEETENVA